MNSNPTEVGSKANGKRLFFFETELFLTDNISSLSTVLAVSIRTRKGLKPDVPPYDTYYDKL